jgi:hypothetical protein
VSAIEGRAATMAVRASITKTRVIVLFITGPSPFRLCVKSPAL